MSLINCPECGQQVSSNSEQCIHCGYKFKVCPECKTPLAKDAKQCNNCGYLFSDIKTDEAESIKATNDGLVGEWRKNALADQGFIYVLKYVNWISIIAMVLVVIIAVIILLVWKADDPLEKIANMEDVKNGIMFLTAIFCIGLIIENTIDYGKETFIKVRCAKWLKENKADFENDINERLQAAEGDYDTASEDDDFVLLMECCWIGEKPSVKKYMYISIVIKFLVGVALAICFGIAVSRNLDCFFKAEMYSQSFEYDQPSVIALAIALLIDTPMLFAVNKLQKKSFNKWKEQHFTK